MLTIGLISLLGAMSPGPDFAIVTKNCLTGTFRTGVLTALGVSFALLVHVTYCLFGIALLIAETPALFLGLKYLGAAYLLYLGIRMLIEKRTSPEGPPPTASSSRQKKTPAVCFRIPLQFVKSEGDVVRFELIYPVYRSQCRLAGEI